MPKGDTVIVSTVVATNIRVIAINSKGEILASESLPNKYKAGSGFPSIQDLGYKRDLG